MKKLWILLAAIAVAVLFSNCNLVSPKTSIDQCISNFMNDINSNQGNAYTTLDNTSSYYGEVAALPTYWNTWFPSGNSYTLTNQSTSGSTVTATLSSSTNPVYSSGVSIVFTMSTDITGNAVIHAISLHGLSIFS
jgi:hypothetical protein